MQAAPSAITAQPSTYARPNASATTIPLISFVEPRQGFVGLYLILAGFAALTFVAALVFPRTPSETAVGQIA
jgi:hypothetical protein